jgi:hypothetical protein
MPDRYLAGFRNLDGEPWGLIVPLDGNEVRRAVASDERKWAVVMYQIEGLIHSQPDAAGITSPIASTGTTISARNKTGREHA